MNIYKTVSTLFHLDNHKAHMTMKLKIDNTHLQTEPNPKYLQAEPNPKYLGVILDRTLTFKNHLKNVSKKIRTRTSLIRKLTGTKWGACKHVLRTSTLALCYSVAEYCVPAWVRLTLTNMINNQFRSAMHIITRTLKPTPIQRLPTMVNIALPEVRRNIATTAKHKHLLTSPKNTPLAKCMQNAPKTARLKSRHPFYNTNSAPLGTKTE